MTVDYKDMEHIKLSDIWQLSNVSDYKVHFAKWNGDERPLETLTRSMENWKGWQEYYPSKITLIENISSALHKSPMRRVCGWLVAFGK